MGKEEEEEEEEEEETWSVVGVVKGEGSGLHDSSV